jgi:hypothetical protein
MDVSYTGSFSFRKVLNPFLPFRPFIQLHQCVSSPEEDDDEDDGGAIGFVDFGEGG